MSFRIIWIEFDGTVKMCQRFPAGFERNGRENSKSAQAVVVGIEAGGGFSHRPHDFGLLEPRCDRPYYTTSNLVLQVEHIFTGTIITFHPKMLAGRRIDKLGRNADSSPALRILPSST